MAIPTNEAGQADVSLPANSVGMDIQLIVVDGAPKPFDQDVVVGGLSFWPSDLDLLTPQLGPKVRRGELAPSVGVEDLRHPAIAKGNDQNLQPKLCLKTVGEYPAEHMHEVEIHDCHHVQSPYAVGCR